MESNKCVFSVFFEFNVVIMNCMLIQTEKQLPFINNPCDLITLTTLTFGAVFIICIATKLRATAQQHCQQYSVTNELVKTQKHAKIQSIRGLKCSEGQG